MSKDKNSSYSRIMKSSSLIGGAQGVNMLIGMVRVKFVALLIGPIGVGLVATYRATVSMIGIVAGLGLQGSAVREVAEAVGSGDDERIGRSVLTLHRMCWLTGSLGTLVVVLASRKLSLITFGTTEHTLNVALVGLTILFVNLQQGQMAVVQGSRRIGDLARLNVVGVVIGSIVSVGFYAWLGVKGIVPAIVLLGLLELGTAWWFARKIPIPSVTMSWWESFRVAGGMVKLGLAFMWNSFLVAAVAYVTRTMIAREIDLVAVGIYSAAFSLSGMIVNFILGAMGADYFPSLAAVSSDHAKMRQLVNQQTEIGLLLALPGLIATLAFAPWAIKLFYTSEFWPAVDLLRWFILGCLGRVISWPLGYIVLAKGASRLFALTETLANVIHVGLIWVLLGAQGLKGVSIAFFTLYIVYTLIMVYVSWRLIGFVWSRGVWRLFGVVLPVVVGSFLVGKVLPLVPATVIGILVTAAVCFYCMHGIASRLGPGHKICRILRKIPFMGFVMPCENR